MLKVPKIMLTGYSHILYHDYILKEAGQRLFMTKKNYL